MYLTLDYGKFPWIAVLLARAFALYGLLKKTADIDPMSGLMIETMLLSPIALAIIVYHDRLTTGNKSNIIYQR